MNSSFCNDMCFLVQLGSETQQLEWAKRESQREEAGRNRRLRLQEKQDLALALSRAEMPRTWIFGPSAGGWRWSVCPNHTPFLKISQVCCSDHWTNEVQQNQRSKLRICSWTAQNAQPLYYSLKNIIYSFTKYCRTSWRSYKWDLYSLKSHLIMHRTLIININPYLRPVSVLQSQKCFISQCL